MNNKEREEKYFFKTYKRLDIEINRGEGCYLITTDGIKFLDMFGGLAVNSLGYSHPRIKDAIIKQLDRYIHLSNLFLQGPQIDLAELLLNYSGYKKIFFSNSGTEAMEGAIKLARKWRKIVNKKEIISFSGSFHGRTMGALSLTHREKYRVGYEPFLDGTVCCIYNNSEDLISRVDNNTLAVVLEFIQGESGVVMAQPDFVDTIRYLHGKYNFLLIADEIQSGLGRTGKLFAFNHFDISPDIVVLAKPLGGGMPLGAFIGNEKVADVFTYGVHGTTFGGNPVACAAGVAMLKEIIENGIMQNADIVGKYLIDLLYDLKKKYKSIIDVRGKGLMIGIEFTNNCEKIVTEMLKRKVLVNCTNDKVIRLLPPLILTKKEVDSFIMSLDDVLCKDFI